MAVLVEVDPLAVALALAVLPVVGLRQARPEVVILQVAAVLLVGAGPQAVAQPVAAVLPEAAVPPDGAVLQREAQLAAARP